MREIKLLHQVQHENIVRIFNYFIYPEAFTGYILMEHVEGKEIDQHLSVSPESLNDLFVQAIAGFAYLERNNILHRDIRPENMMVREDGRLKIIDLGFGKKIVNSADFRKSISLNWACTPPDEFADGVYDFQSEVYFVGKLFHDLYTHKTMFVDFDHDATLDAMCECSPSRRLNSFAEAEARMQASRLGNQSFGPYEIQCYRSFSSMLMTHVSKIAKDAMYVTDVSTVRARLEETFQSVMLEQELADSSLVINCFIQGGYYRKKGGFKVETLQRFLEVFRSAGDVRSRIMLENIQTSLNAVPRYVSDDDIPF